MFVDFRMLLRHCSSVMPSKIRSSAISIPISQMRKLGLREGQNSLNAVQPISAIPATELSRDSNPGLSASRARLLCQRYSTLYLSRSK